MRPPATMSFKRNELNVGDDLRGGAGKDNLQVTALVDSCRSNLVVLQMPAVSLLCPGLDASRVLAQDFEAISINLGLGDDILDASQARTGISQMPERVPIASLGDPAMMSFM